MGRRGARRAVRARDRLQGARRARFRVGWRVRVGVRVGWRVRVRVKVLVRVRMWVRVRVGVRVGVGFRVGLGLVFVAHRARVGRPAWCPACRRSAKNECGLASDGGPLAPNTVRIHSQSVTISQTWRSNVTRVRNATRPTGSRIADRGAIPLCNSFRRCRPSEVLSVPQAMTWYQLANNERVGEEIE